jgi:G:T-mismatch repair DNA endonuclease (very short patch repair protein)
MGDQQRTSTIFFRQHCLDEYCRCFNKPRWVTGEHWRERFERNFGRDVRVSTLLLDLSGSLAKR